MRLLRGVLSQIAWSLSQIHALGVGCHFWAILALFGLAAGMVFPLAYALRHRDPVAVSVTALATGQSDATYVQVSGLAMYANPMVLETRESEGGPVTNEEFYWSLLDRKGAGRLFVHADEDPSNRPMEAATLTGRLRRPPVEVRRGLEGIDSALQPTLSSHVLEPGQRPIPLAISAALLIFGLAGGLLLLLGMKSNFTVFTPMALESHGQPSRAPTAERPIGCLATGEIPLTMPGGNIKRVPARDIRCELVPGQTEEGHPLGHFLLSRVSAGGVVMNSEMALPPGTETETGVVTRGVRDRPALRLQTEDFAGSLIFETPGDALAASEALAKP